MSLEKLFDDRTTVSSYLRAQLASWTVEGLLAVITEACNIVQQIKLQLPAAFFFFLIQELAPYKLVSQSFRRRWERGLLFVK